MVISDWEARANKRRKGITEVLRNWGTPSLYVFVLSKLDKVRLS